MELIRSLILLLGWPILISGSIYLFYRTYEFYLAVGKNVWGKLVLTMVIGWLLTMYSLGFVSTAFLFASLTTGIYVVLPIFGGWFLTMILITALVLQWNKKAVEVNKFNLQLQTMVDERTKDLSLEKQIAEAERNKLTVVIASITDGILAIDLDRKIRLANAAVEQITGYKPEELLGKHILEILSFTENGTPLGEKDVCPIRTDGFEGSLIQKDSIKLKGKNSEKFVTLTVSQIKESMTAKLGCIVTLHDRTKDEELEEMKLDFVSMAAHELRTPLTSIRGYIDLLNEEYSNTIGTEGKEYINRLMISTSNLSRLIDNLLNVSRIERNTFKIEMSPIDIVAVIKTTISNISQQAKSKNQNILFPDPQPSLAPVMADGFRMGQVLTNLLANAINYTQEGGLITVSATDHHDTVQIEVTDNGQGIPKDAIPKLFTKFFRISGVLEQGSKGNGLGLYITKSIIDMHKGTIHVDSVLGKGTTFLFTLPKATAEQITQFAQLNKDRIQNTHHTIVYNTSRTKKN